jgi:hypothetical protein
VHKVEVPDEASTIIMLAEVLCSTVGGLGGWSPARIDGTTAATACQCAPLKRKACISGRYRYGDIDTDKEVHRASHPAIRRKAQRRTGIRKVA